MEQLVQMCENVKNMGWVESKRSTGNFTGGAGQTFEYYTIGRFGDSSQEADYNGIEFKTSFKGGSARVTLFTKTPEGTKIRELWERYGMPRRDGKMRLYDQVRYKPRPGFTFIENGDRVEIWHNDSYTGAYMTLDGIIARTKKINTLLIADYLKEKQNGREHFLYTGFDLFSGFDVGRFFAMLKNGDIVYEFRCSGFPDGKGLKDRGSAFRISGSKLPELYKERVVI